eukprot:TRINITY_DN88_c0_g1_i1.p2 TRINITY_DN88_c0_g1~~TRINITY_DN88_c0_g1_i1.p2  ORF type:complete len:149 (+),score=50.73 TRINITY_DN88_c0_g1_i1:77-523(+)
MAHIEEGVYEIQIVHSGKFLDVEGSSDANCARVIQYPRTGGENQRFLIEHHSGPWYVIYPEHVDDEKAFDVDGGSRDNEAQIISYDYHGGDNQLFCFEPDHHGSYFIKNKHSGKYLDISGGSTDDCVGVIQYAFNGNNNQKFRLHRYD